MFQPCKAIYSIFSLFSSCYFALCCCGNFIIYVKPFSCSKMIQLLFKQRDLNQIPHRNLKIKCSRCKKTRQFDVLRASRPIFFCDPVRMESIYCYRTRANQLINESNTTGGRIKSWTGYKLLNFRGSVIPVHVRPVTCSCTKLFSF